MPEFSAEKPAMICPLTELQHCSCQLPATDCSKQLMNS